MWKCPNCETLNQGEVCAVCGNSRPENMQQQSQNEHTQNSNKDIKSSGNNNKSMLLLVAILAVVIVAMAAVIISLVINNNGEDGNEVATAIPAATEVVQTPEVVTVTETPQTPAPTVAPEPTAVTGDSADIKWIQDRYYATQDILKDCQVVGNGAGVKYYYYNDELVRIDVPAGYGHEYARDYYFDNDKMYFTLAYLSKTDQHRLYFKDGWLIRWKDDLKNIHNNQYSNQDYRDWNYSIQQDVAQYELY